jgi:iron complex outermembrane receptor protein
MVRRFHVGWSSLLLSAAVFLLIPVICAAQDSDPPNSALEEIVVSAQRRPENLQNVPISVSALNGRYLAENNVHSLQDLSATVPSLVVTNSIGYGLAPITIRGLGGPNGGGSLFTDQPVAVYIDDVYVPALAQSVSDLADVDSLQVLRGPQGTLYGRNSTAGAILITSNRPTTELEAGASATYSSYSDFHVSGFISGPLSQSVSGRLACVLRDGGNWAHNLITGRDVGGGQGQSCRGTLEFRLNDDATLDLIGDFSHGTDYPATESLALITQLPAGAIPVLGPVYVGNPFTRRPDLSSLIGSNDVSLHVRQFTTTNADDVTAHLKWKLGGANFDSISGWRSMRLTGEQDASPGTLPPALLGDNTSTQLTHSFSEEARLSSADDAAALKWVTGVFYYHQYNDDVIDIVNLQAGAPVASVGGGPAPVFAGAVSGTNALFSGTQTVNAYAAFADLSFELSKGWSVSAGARYSYEDKHAAIGQLVETITPTIIAGPTLFAGSCPSSTVPCSRSFSNFSPRATLNFKPDRETLLYASYARGFNSGGFNTFGDVATPNDSSNPLEARSETIDSYEIGSKNEVLDGHLRLNVDAFLADYSNLQIRQAVFTGGVAVVNVPKAQTKGIELESEYVPLDRLTVSLSGSYLDARITEGTLAALPSNIGPIVFGQSVTIAEQNVAGNRLTRAPRWQLRLAPDYRWPVEVGTLDLSAAYRFESGVYFSETNQDANQYYAPSWHDVDLRATWTPQGRHWDVAVFARNALNERHITQIAPYNGFPIATLNEPRIVGVTITGRL